MTKKLNKKMNSFDESSSTVISNYESNLDLDENSISEYESDSDDSESLLTVGTIIGINKPNLSYKSPPLLFYVRINGKSYRSCQWATKDEVCQTKRGSFLYGLYVNKHSVFEKFGQFKKNSIFPVNQKFNLFLPFNSNFGIGHLTPEFIISVKKVNEKKKYLVKWQSLDIDKSTWENDDEIPLNLIESFYQRRKNPHSKSYTPTDGENEPQYKPFKESPIFKNGNKLTDYQVDGLNWLQMCWFQRRNSILSDEMGLGKTIESISIIDCLSKWYPSWGPFLVVCPLSTLHNWLDELKKWTDFRVVSMIGSKENRKIIKENLIYERNGLIENKEKIIFDVLVVSYEWLNMELKFIQQFKFMYTIIDEAHRIKNSNTSVYKNCLSIRSHHFLLMTGTPIQNNLFEIWSLLHFINPSQFDNLIEFESQFSDKENPDTIEKLQEVLRPFIFRRKKNDVSLDLPEKEEIIIEVEMTEIQRTFSQFFIKENLAILKDSMNKMSLNNIMVQLRKLFCHPFLFPNLEEICNTQYKEAHSIPLDEELSIDDEMKSLILASGKMILIDKLLPKLKEKNHKVLIFSQFTSILDILEDYLEYRRYPYERLDGSCATEMRSRSIDNFQKDDDLFIFLLSTRAGGLGINLTKADTVIIYDSDWNPLNDIQAQARCHRIGQSQKVLIYRLVTRCSYESEMFWRASKKLALDYAILDSAPKGNDENVQKKNSLEEKKELEMILKKGAYYTFKDDSSEIDKFCSENIDQILKKRSFTRKDVVSGGNSLFSKVSFDSNTDVEILNENFWDKLTANKKIINFKDKKDKLKSKQEPLKAMKLDGSDDQNKNDSSIVCEYQNVIHYYPKLNENDINLYEISLSDFCNFDSFKKSIHINVYKGALSALEHYGVALSRLFVSESTYEICKTFLIFAFFELPVEWKKIYYSYLKEFIPDFSKQISKTQFKELADKQFVSSLFKNNPLKIIENAFNWDIFYKVALFMTTEKLPENFQFAPEMCSCQGWTPICDFNAVISFLNSDKHSNFIKKNDLPFKSMIDKNPSIKNWIFTRIKLIVSEVYPLIPDTFDIHQPNSDQILKEIGNFEMFSKLNRHVLHPTKMTKDVQKKLLRILYLYGIPKYDAVLKFKEILGNKIINDDLVLLFIVKVLIKAMKHRPSLVDLLKLLPNFDYASIPKNDVVDIRWIDENAIIAVASNLDLIRQIRENYDFFDSRKEIFEITLRNWKEILPKCPWWDFQCDFALFNATACYGFLLNSMFCYLLKVDKPSEFESISYEEIFNWKDQELANLTPIMLKSQKFTWAFCSIDMKIKRIEQILDMVSLDKEYFGI